MGHGIAQLAASNGYTVVGVESNPAALTAGQARIDGSLSKLLGKAVKKGTMTAEAAETKKAETLGNLSYSVDQADLADCDLIVEAIIEDLSIKVPFYEKLGKVVKPSAIFASNTSSLAITKMAVASGRADRFGKFCHRLSFSSRDVCL
jgi:3-hydroxyacyl-CoA dehydrogenase